MSANADPCPYPALHPTLDDALGCSACQARSATARRLAAEVETNRVEVDAEVAAGAPWSTPWSIVDEPAHTPEQSARIWGAPDPVTDRAAWLEWRRHGLGGSDVAALLGLSPFAGPFDVWLSKTQSVDGGSNRAMRSGVLLEQAIAAFAAGELEAELLPSEGLVHPDRAWHRGTPDGYLEGGLVGARAGLECKKVRTLDGWGEPGSGDVPIAYRVQCAWYMGLADLDRWFVAVFATLSEQWEIYTLERDLEIEQALVERARQWWQRHVVEGEMPPLDSTSSCALALHMQHAEPDEELLDVEGEVVDLVEQWQTAKDAERDAKAARAAVEIHVKAAIGDAAGIRWSGGRVKWSRFERTSLDAKQLRNDHPELEETLEQYTRRTPSSRLSAKWFEEQI